MIVILKFAKDSLYPQGDNFLEFTIKINKQSLNFINLKTILPLEEIMCLNSKKKT